jgi:hypothetical protein
VTVRKIFISYARQNKPDVEQLAAHLHVLGYQAWVDSLLRGGQDWWDQILRRISECDVFISIVSQPTLNSAACKREFDWAEALGKPVLPVAIEAMPKILPRRLSSRQIVDYSEPASRDKAALILAGSLASLPAAPRLPSPLPQPPSAPLSYLWDLIDLVSRPTVLTQREQLNVIGRLRQALRSRDFAEAEGAREILQRFVQRDDLTPDVYRQSVELNGLNDPARRTTHIPRPPQPIRPRPSGPPGNTAPRSSYVSDHPPRLADTAPNAQSSSSPNGGGAGSAGHPLFTRRAAIIGIGVAAVAFTVALVLTLWPNDTSSRSVVRETTTTPVSTSLSPTPVAPVPPKTNPTKRQPGGGTTTTTTTTTKSSGGTSDSSVPTPPSTVPRPPPQSPLPGAQQR